MHKKKKREEIPAEAYSDFLEHVIKSMITSGDTDLSKEEGLSIVHFIATSASRKIFSSHDETLESKRAKQFALYLINHRLKERFEGNNVVDVEYKLLNQSDEARYEYNAAAAALKHAIDIPQELQLDHNEICSNLAWGSGSTQGFCFGSSPDEERRKFLAVNMGLNDVKEWICDWMSNKAQMIEKGTESGDKKKDFMEKAKEGRCERWKIKDGKFLLENGEKVEVGLPKKLDSYFYNTEAKASWICRKGPDDKKTGKENEKKVEYYILFRDYDACEELMIFVRNKVKERLRQSTSIGIKVFDTTREYLKE